MDQRRYPDSSNGWTPPPSQHVGFNSASGSQNSASSSSGMAPTFPSGSYPSRPNINHPSSMHYPPVSSNNYMPTQTQPPSTVSPSVYSSTPNSAPPGNFYSNPYQRSDQMAPTSQSYQSSYRYPSAPFGSIPPPPIPPPPSSMDVPPPPIYAPPASSMPFSNSDTFPSNSNPSMGAPLSAIASGSPRSPNIDPSARSQQSMKRSNSRIDPAQMPRPPSQPSVERIQYFTQPGSGRRVPPISNANFQVIDNGNASPRFMRVTMTAVPLNKTILSNVGIPWSAICTPFAPLEHDEEEIPLIDMGSSPLRCSRCEAYINNYVSWGNHGNSWICNLCKMSNQVPNWYYSSLDGVGLRLDRKSRMELSKGTVDFLVGNEYLTRNRKPEACFLFAIDISSTAVFSGLTSAVLNSLRSLIPVFIKKNIPIGIFSFAKKIQFFDVNIDAAEPFKVIIADSDDPYSVYPKSKLVSKDEKHLNFLIDKIIEFIPSLYGTDTREGSNNINSDTYALSCPMAAMEAAKQAFAVDERGGRILIFTSSSSTAGSMSMKNRTNEYKSLYGTSNEMMLYTDCITAGNSSKSNTDKAVFNKIIFFADECMQACVCIDIFVLESSQRFNDVALLAEVCDRTGGCVHLIPENLTNVEALDRLQLELSHLVNSYVGNNVLLKMRTSIGCFVDKVIGKGDYDNLRKELFVPSVNSSTTISFFLKHDGELRDEEPVYLQLATLLTRIDGTIIVRVHNMCTYASKSVRDVFKYSDLEALVCTLCKTSIDDVFLYPLLVTEKNNPRITVVLKCLELLLKYRKECAPQSPPAQLILPEAMKLLPLYLLCILKHPILLENTSTPSNEIIIAEKTKAGDNTIRVLVRCNERAAALRRLRGLPVSALVNSLLPRLFALHNLDIFSETSGYEVDPQSLSSQTSSYSEDENITVVSRLPKLLSVTSEVFESDGVYLLDDGDHFFIYVGRNVSMETLEEWFEVPSPFSMSCSPQDAYPTGTISSLPERPSTLRCRRNTVYGRYIAGILMKLRCTSPFKQGNAIDRIAFVIYAFQFVADDNNIRLLVMLDSLDIVMIWAGEPSNEASTRFGIRLVEDSLFGALSYVDFLCNLHAKIQTKL